MKFLSICLIISFGIVFGSGQNETNSSNSGSSSNTTNTTSVEKSFESEMTTNFPSAMEIQSGEIETTTESEDAVDEFKKQIAAGEVEVEIIQRDWDTPGRLPLPPDYNKNDLPKPNYQARNNEKAKPFKVGIFINVRGINSIDMKEERITMDIDLYTFWSDTRFHWDLNSTVENESSSSSNAGSSEEHNHRQHHPHSKNHTETIRLEIEKLHTDFANSIWAPDVIIENTVVVPHNDLTSEPLLSFNNHIGFIKYIRLEVSVPCPMSYFYYPLDTQKCQVTIRSYKYFSEQLELNWASEGVYMAKANNSNYEIQVESASKFTRRVNSLHFPNIVDRSKAIPHIVVPEKTFDVLAFVISLRRNVSYHLAQTYLPSGFFIIITWLCFLLPPGMAASRVGITMTTLLTINTMFNSVREHSPQVTYAKAIDLWMVACTFFAFLSMVEFVCMSWLEAVKDREESRKKEHAQELKKLQEIEVFEAANEKTAGQKSYIETNITTNIKLMNDRKLERVLYVRKFLKNYGLSVVIAAFSCFNVAYWGWICFGSEYLSWSVSPHHNDVN